MPRQAEHQTHANSLVPKPVMRSILGQAPGVDERAIDLGYPSDVGEDGGAAGHRHRRTPSLTRPQTPGPAATPPAPGPAQIVSLAYAVGENDGMSFDQYQPYGPVVETTMRIVTWNVWGRYGSWRERQAGIEETLAASAPDVVCLVESWSHPESAQPELVARRLGFAHSLFCGDWQQDEWVSGIGLATRWPVTSHESRPLRGEDGSGTGSALFALVDGDRGPIQLFVVILDYPLGASAVRQAQLRQLAGFIQDRTRRRHPIVVCGDFNAGPDADEIRMLTGKTTPVAPGLVFYDAWEVAGDGTPGCTWSNQNPLAAVALYPDRRFDYVLSAWPRRGGVGHPTLCRRLGVLPPDQPQLSDHYGVLADLRY